MTIVLPANFGSYRMILRVAGPLILSHTSIMLMQVVDGLFLAWHSPDAIAALGPAGLMFWAVCIFFNGITGYTGTFVAQYYGAGRPQRIGAAVWQGVYLGLAGGAVILSLAPLAGPLFAWMGHDPPIAALEASYFRISCLGGPVFVVAPALSGFFAGRHETGRLMLVQMIGVAVNAVLDWGLIFGKLGLPAMGIRGAALATVIGHGVVVALLLGMFLHGRYRRGFGTWSGRRPDGRLMGRLIRFGTPAGARMLMEVTAWTMFVIFIGRVDAVSLTATSIAFRINTVAFFPAIGLAIATSMLVGQAQGAGRSDLAQRAAWRCLAVGEAWMLSAALCFVLIPELLVRAFLDPATAGPQQAQAIQTMGVLLLRFVALYCVMDACNIILVGALEGAGDTRWTATVAVLMHALFLGLLVMLDRLAAGTLILWAAATVFVILLSLFWLVRFRGGAWRSKRVIEHTPPDLEAALSVPGPAATVAQPKHVEGKSAADERGWSGTYGGSSGELQP